MFNKTKQFVKKSSAPGSEAAPDKWLVQKKVGFPETVLHQAAQLPETSGSVAKMRPTAAAKGVERLLGGPGGGAPRKAGGAGGRSPPPPAPKFEPKFIFKLPVWLSYAQIEMSRVID